MVGISFLRGGGGGLKGELVPLTKLNPNCERVVAIALLRLSISFRLQNLKLNRQMRFSLPSIKCSAAFPSFRLYSPNCDQRFVLITARSTIVGSLEEPPNIRLTVEKNAFVD